MKAHVGASLNGRKRGGLTSVEGLKLPFEKRGVVVGLGKLKASKKEKKKENLLEGEGKSLCPGENLRTCL